MALDAGARLGHFRVLSQLGRGGMGEVYLAEDTRLKRRVAIKKLFDTLPDTAHWVKRLRREAEALAAVNHPNVVTVHAVEELDDVLFLVMELVEGRTLADLIPPEGFPVPRLFELAIPIASALSAAHARGVVHGDLKPGNVMVTSEGRIKVLCIPHGRRADAPDGRRGDAGPARLAARPAGRPERADHEAVRPRPHRSRRPRRAGRWTSSSFNLSRAVVTSGTGARKRGCAPASPVSSKPSTETRCTRPRGLAWRTPSTCSATTASHIRTTPGRGSWPPCRKPLRWPASRPTRSVPWRWPRGSASSTGPAPRRCTGARSNSTRRTP